MVMRKGFDAGAHLFRLLTTPIKPAAHVHPPYLQRYVESMCTSQVVLLTGAHQARPLHAQRTRTAQPIESKRARPPLLNNTPIKPAAHVHPPYLQRYVESMCTSQVVLLTGAHQARPLHAQRTRTAQPIESKRARPPLLNNTPIKPAAHVHPPYAPSLSTLLCANPHTPPTIGLGCPPRGAIPAGEGGWRGTPSTGRGGGAPRAAHVFQAPPRPYAPSLSTLLCANPHTPPTIGLGCPPRGAIPAGEGGWRGTPSTGRGGGAPRAAHVFQAPSSAEETGYGRNQQDSWRH